MKLKICRPLAFLADFVIIEVDFFEGFTNGCVAEGARYGAGHWDCFFSLECRGQAWGMWNLVMQHAKHPSTGVVFLFLNRICKCICVHHLSLRLLALLTMFFLILSFVCILFILIPHVQGIHFLCFYHSCCYTQDCSQLLVTVQRHLLWVCKTFVMCDFGGRDFLNISYSFRIVQLLENTEPNNVKTGRVMMKDRNFGKIWT